jgi:cytoskeletal protein RodZ
MTARDHLRVGNRRFRRDRAPIDAAPAPRLGEMLQLARERKGVDLYRAERDTKIRLRYLAALEDGDFDELPGAVYTKGFLRNYAIYLGLDPEDLLERWHDEMAALHSTERVVVAPPPQPITSPRSFVNLSPGMAVTGVALLVILLFVGYLGLTLLRLAEVPELKLTSPANRVSEINAERTMLVGTAGAGSLISITTPNGQLMTTIADDDGRWSQEVALARGQNNFQITARDPATQQQSPPLELIISVPLPGSSQAPDSPPPAVAEIRLLLYQPADEYTSTDGRVTISGSTSANSVSVRATLLGPVSPSPSVPDLATPTPSTTDQPDVSPSPSPTPAMPQQLTVGSTGGFSGTLELAAGRWQIDVTAFATGMQSRSVSRHVTVTSTGPAGAVEVVLSIVGGNSWTRAVADGVVVKGYRGKLLRAGSTHTLSAQNELYLRVGNSGAMHVIFNGQDLGALGRSGEVSSWLFRPGQPAERATQGQ